jgi:hypothetical protein
MFVITRDASAAMRVIATLLAIALVMWTLGSYTFAEAANITEVEDLITDSSPLADSNHTITFRLASTLADAQTIIVNFDSANGFDFTGVTAGDFAITAGTATFSEAVNTGTDTITFTKTGGAAVANDLVTVTINGTNKINNPDPADGNQSYEIDISAGTDTGHTRVVILDTVLVTAQVLTTFDFTVYGLATSTTVNGTTTTGTSGSTTLPYGTLTANIPEILGHDLTVATNARNGFVVTVEQDGYFDSSTGAIIDNYQDGTLVTVPEPWVAPSNNVNLANTWGHWGITSEDDDTVGNRGADEFDLNEWAGVTTTPTVIFAHDAPADETTPGIGSTTVAYKVQITPLQEAGDDYSTTLTYIATPTF